MLRTAEAAHVRLDKIDSQLRTITSSLQKNTALTEQIALDTTDMIKLFKWTSFTRKVIYGLVPVIATCFAAWAWFKVNIKIL